VDWVDYESGWHREVYAARLEVDVKWFYLKCANDKNRNRLLF